MAELTKDEKTLLAEIVNDKFSVGAFSGMIFNAVVQYKISGIDQSVTGGTNELINKLIKTALTTRLQMKELSK